MRYLSISRGEIFYNNSMKNVKNLRLQYGYTQQYVASKLNIKQNTYSQYETGAREISIDMLIALATFYNTSTDYVLGLTEEEEAYPKI